MIEILLQYYSCVTPSEKFATTHKTKHVSAQLQYVASVVLTSTRVLIVLQLPVLEAVADVAVDSVHAYVIAW